MNYVYLSIFLGVALLIVSVLLVMCYNTPRQMTNDQLRTAMLSDFKSNDDVPLDVIKWLISNRSPILNSVYNVKNTRTLVQNIMSTKQCTIAELIDSPDDPMRDCTRYFARASRFEQATVLALARAIKEAQIALGKN